MMKPTTYLTWLAVAMAADGCAQRAEAKYVAVFTEDDSDVIEAGKGALDLTDLRVVGRGLTNPFVSPIASAYASGALGVLGRSFVGAISGPDDFGSGLFAKPGTSSGDAVGFSAMSRFVFVPDDYTFGAPLSETSTYLGATFASLGMTPGTYVYSWGSGAHADTLTVVVGASPVPELSTWAMMLTGFAGLGYAAVRRKGRAARTAA